MAERRSDGHRSSGWSLYWVASDGVEDCFIVARNWRSARKLETEIKGFYPDEMNVERVLSIPVTLEKSYLQRCKKDPTLKPWPWYADTLLLKKIGAQFRDIDGCREILINDTVFTNSADGPIMPRSIGWKAIQEFMADPVLASYGEEDSYSPPQLYLLKELGVCVARCHEIEHYITHSFIFCMSEKEKRRYSTINNLIDGWKKKTLGQLLAIIRDAYEIEPIVKASLDIFLDVRNQLVHGVTTNPRYDIRTSWGQKELLVFLMSFERFSRPIRKAFRSSFYASIDFGANYFLKDEEKPKKFLTKKQDKEIDLFFAYFSPKSTTSNS